MHRFPIASNVVNPNTEKLPRIFAMFDWVYLHPHRYFQLNNITDPGNVFVESSTSMVMKLSNHLRYLDAHGLLSHTKDRMLAIGINDHRITQIHRPVSWLLSSGLFSRVYYEAKNVSLFPGVGTLPQGLTPHYMRNREHEFTRAVTSASLNSKRPLPQTLCAYGAFHARFRRYAARKSASEFGQQHDWVHVRRIPRHEWYETLAEYPFLISPVGQGTLVHFVCCMRIFTAFSDPSCIFASFHNINRICHASACL